MRKLIILGILMMISVLVWSETVYEIQYTTDPGGASPLEGQTVTVTGIVTATNWYSSGNANRFFISDPEGGEWHGVFVFNYDYTVELGDEVELTAEVQEYYGFTELGNVSALTVVSSGNTVPDPVVVTTAALAESEALEGVLVQVNDVMVTQDPDQYGQAYIDDGSGACQTDDAMYDYEPVSGAEYSYIRGVVDYSYDEYGLNPRFLQDIGFSGEPGIIEGYVELEGGTGNIEEVIISTSGYETNPDDGGEYELELAPGTYDVTASLAGYSPQTITGVVVQEDETTSGIDFSLSPMEELTIYEIQYTEDASGDSPYAEMAVTVTGIVTGSGFAGGNHFFISSLEGGAWNGLYVYQYDYEVNEGDEVTVSGTISEYYNYTELTDLTELVINSSGNPLPEAVEISTSDLASTEAYEGVLVKINNVSVTVLPNDYNEWFVDDGSGECQVDDGFDAIYPDLAVGDEFNSITGLVDYNFSEYGLNPRSLSDFDTGQTPELTAIYDIQYTEDASGDSPYMDQEVTVEGIVTAIGHSGDRFFISSPAGGAWEGIYVFEEITLPVIGDEVRVSATVAEYFGFTELSDVTSVEILSSGNTLPEAVEINTGELASEEAYESVLVKISNLEVSTLPNEYFEWYVNDGSGECQIDDGFELTFPELDLGDAITSITGIVDYSYSEYALNPRSENDIELTDAEDIDVLSIADVQAYPNPFAVNSQRSAVTISFSLAKESDVTVSVYNIKGQKIAQLFEGIKPAGTQRVEWNGSGSDGALEASGVYFYAVVTGKSQTMGKLLLIR